MLRGGVAGWILRSVGALLELHEALKLVVGRLVGCMLIAKT